VLPTASSTVIAKGTTTSGTVNAFRVFGVPVRLHFTFILFVIFLTVSVLGNSTSPAGSALFLAGGLLSVLLHEFGHATVAASFGVRTSEIVMFPIGGLSRLERPLRPLAEACVAFAGPLVNLALAGGIFAYLVSEHEATPIHLSDFTHPNGKSAMALLLYGNILLAVFNLLPAFPMDGGRILRALLRSLRPDEEATRIAAWMGRMLAIGMGLYGLIAGQFLLVFFALFIYLGAAQESVAAFGRSLTHGVPVRSAMITEFRTLEHNHTVKEAANLLLATSQQDFPVQHAGQVVGLLGRNHLLKALAAEGPDVYVAGAMDRDFLSFHPETDLSEILPQMAHSGSCALVMDGDKVTGLITTDNLSEFLLLRRFGLEL